MASGVRDLCLGEQVYHCLNLTLGFESSIQLLCMFLCMVVCVNMIYETFNTIYIISKPLYSFMMWPQQIGYSRYVLIFIHPEEENTTNESLWGKHFLCSS